MTPLSRSITSPLGILPIPSKKRPLEQPFSYDKSLTFHIGSSPQNRTKKPAKKFVALKKSGVIPKNKCSTNLAALDLSTFFQRALAIASPDKDITGEEADSEEAPVSF